MKKLVSIDPEELLVDKPGFELVAAFPDEDDDFFDDDEEDFPLEEGDDFEYVDEDGEMDDFDFVDDDDDLDDYDDDEDEEEEEEWARYSVQPKRGGKPSWDDEY